MLRIIFREPTKEQLEHIYRAEDELSKAGVSFDVGKSYDDVKVLSRDFERHIGSVRTLLGGIDAN